MRVLLIGTLTGVKGRQVVEACVRESAGTLIEFMLIGATQPPFCQRSPSALRKPAHTRNWSCPGVWRNCVACGLVSPAHPGDLQLHAHGGDRQRPADRSLANRRLARAARWPFAHLARRCDCAGSQVDSHVSVIKDELSTAALSPQTGKRRRAETYYPDGYLNFSDLKALPPP